MLLLNKIKYLKLLHTDKAFPNQSWGSLLHCFHTVNELKYRQKVQANKQCLHDNQLVSSLAQHPTHSCIHPYTKIDHCILRL